MKIAAVSDVTLGYGFPQLEMLVQSLARTLNAEDAVIFEADGKRKPRLHTVDDIRIERIGTRFAPYFRMWHTDYNRLVLKRLKQLNPDIVISIGANSWPAILGLGDKPPLVICYMFESLSYQEKLGGYDFLRLNMMATDWVDLIIVPEIRRADFDLKRINWTDKQVVEVYNTSKPGYLGRDDVRTEKMIMAGSLCDDTLISHFQHDRFVNDITIDLAGIVSDDSASQVIDWLSTNNALSRYIGNLPIGDLEAQLPSYAFSVCMWSPKDVNQIFASPNKLFQSIAYGVPPICAPHPQCVDIIRKFDCGVLMDDWSQQALLKAVDRAKRIFGTPRYTELVGNCRHATESELNWPNQFRKIIQNIKNISAWSQLIQTTALDNSI